MEQPADYDRWLYGNHHGVMYFVAIRPQKKEQKKQSQMLSALEVGDIVLTTSGFTELLSTLQMIQ